MSRISIEVSGTHRAPVAGKLTGAVIRRQQSWDRRDWDGRTGTQAARVVIPLAGWDDGLVDP